MKKLLSGLTAFIIVANPFYKFEIKANDQFDNSIFVNADQEFILEAEYNPDKYILGKGDSLNIIFEEIEVLSLKNVLIGPDGYIYLKQVGRLYADGKTIDQLSKIIYEKYSNILLEKPTIRILINKYRPVTVYVSGEVAKEGYYILTGKSFFAGQSFGAISPETKEYTAGKYSYSFPTLFDALKAANGVTLYSDLSNISIVRKVPEIDGGGKIKTNINFENLVLEGDLSNNINLMDGDVIKVSRSEEKQNKIFFIAANSNLNPSNIEVFINGSVDRSGKLLIPSGSSLTQAINLSGKKLLSGKIEFFRFRKDGEFEKRVFNYNPSSKIGTYKNPILMSNDFIRVQDSLFTNSTKVLNTITSPVVTGLGIKEIFD